MLPVHLMKAGEQADEDEEKKNPCARNKETIVRLGKGISATVIIDSKRTRDKKTA